MSVEIYGNSQFEHWKFNILANIFNNKLIIKVDILQKNASTANGYKWYKVKYGSYTGYVASEYLDINKKITVK